MYLILPSDFSSVSGPRALAVVLHTWSNDLEERHPEVEQGADRRGWILLVPNFRGRNDHPEACGSPLAQQDILDAVKWASNYYPVDRQRIYLLGMSGGGYMTMLMVAHHPNLPGLASATWKLGTKPTRQGRTPR